MKAIDFIQHKNCPHCKGHHAVESSSEGDATYYHYATWTCGFNPTQLADEPCDEQDWARCKFNLGMGNSIQT